MPATLAAPPRAAAQPAARCLYCGGADLAPLFRGVRDRLGFVPGDRGFDECRACGSAVQTPLPKAEELAGFYPPVYSFTLELGREQSRVKRILARAEYECFFRPTYRTQVKQVMAAAGWRRGDGKSLLDVGCGRGLRLLEFRRLGFNVHGLDVLPDVVRYLNEELRIPAVTADVAELAAAHPPASFDCVTAFFLIEHVPDVAQVIRDCYRLLKPGGWLAAAVPLRDCPQGRLFGKRWINVTEAPRHLSLPTRAGMTNVCRAAGFEQIDIRPDSVLTVCGQIGLSLMPGVAITNSYGRPGLWPLVTRAAGAAVSLAAIPAVYAENHILGTPSSGIVCARKPGGNDARA